MSESNKKQRRVKLSNEKRYMNKLKEEIAGELGLGDDIAERGWANLTSRETGKVGGYVAKRLRDKRLREKKGMK